MAVKKSTSVRELDEGPVPFLGAKPDKIAEADGRREKVRAFMEARGLKAKTWAKDAGLSPGVLLNFLNGHANSLSQRSFEKLAAQQRVTIAEIIGEIVPSQVPGKDLIAVPYISVTTAKGGAAAVVMKQSRQALFFKRSKLDEITGGKPSRLGVYEVTGDAMEPALRAGDVVLLNLDETDVARTPGVYCFWNGHAIDIKRLSRNPGLGNTIRVQSDNKERYPAVDVPAPQLQIFGRVIWRSGAF